jgi:Amt family ammonium transporter
MKDSMKPCAAENGPNRDIPDRELVLHYQPEVSLCDRKLVGFEALVRWNHPERGLLGPENFLRSAEETGLIIPLSRWVLNEACRQMAFWHRVMPAQRSLTIAVNTSIEYLTDPCLIGDIGRILFETGLTPRNLRLEVNEPSIIAHGEIANMALRQLKAMQVGLEIDGFGTGHASVDYLRKLPFDTLKIDSSFVKELGTRNDSSGIIDTILTFVGSLGMTAAAEGVETRDQFNKLAALGCDSGQGFFFSRPVIAARAKRLIQDEIHEEATFRSSIHLVDTSTPG